VGGEDSWHPESLCVSACTGMDHGLPMVQAACSERHTIAANAATLTANWTIERMPMCSSQNQGSNVNSIAPLRFLAPRKSSVRSS
jgi:hypothetical protein